MDESFKTRFFIIRLCEKPRKIIGPATYEEMRTYFEEERISWSDLGWSPDSPQPWARLFQMSSLIALMEKFPSDEKLEKYQQLCRDAINEKESTALSTRLTPQTQLHSAPPPLAEKTLTTEIPTPPPVAPVFLLINGNEKGPLQLNEVTPLLQQQLASEKNHAPIYIWYDGLSTWHPADENRKMPAREIIEGRDARKTKRKQMPAFVYWVSDKQPKKFLGICTDISTAGMQVWLEKEQDELKTDAKIQVELVPISVTGLPTIPIQGRIVWHSRKTAQLGIYFLTDNLVLNNYLSKLLSDLT